MKTWDVHYRHATAHLPVGHKPGKRQTFRTQAENVMAAVRNTWETMGLDPGVTEFTPIEVCSHFPS